jgi:hypothetical protein
MPAASLAHSLVEELEFQIECRFLPNRGRSCPVLERLTPPDSTRLSRTIRHVTPASQTSSQKRRESVTYVSGTICHLCVGSLAFILLKNLDSFPRKGLSGIQRRRQVGTWEPRLKNIATAKKVRRGVRRRPTATTRNSRQGTTAKEIGHLRLLK